MVKKKKLIRITTVPITLDYIKGQISYLNNEFDVMIVSSKGDKLVDISKREGVDYRSVDMERRISIFKDIKSIYKMFILLRRESPFIVHSMTPKAGMVTMIAAFLAGVPHRIHTFTGLIFPTATSFKRIILVLVDKLTCWCATKIIPEGEGVKSDLIDNRITRKKLKVIGYGNINGINVNEFNRKLFSDSTLCELRNVNNICDDDFVFLFVGRIVKDKGIQELVEAFVLLNKENPKSKLLILGDFEKDLDPVPIHIEKEINNNNSIIYVGFKEDIRPYFAISNVFILPSYREGFPNVVLQAGAMEVPSIVTNINGSNEIIEDGINGVIIPSKNIELLYQSMKRLHNDSQFLNKLKKNCRNKILNKYEQSFVWKEILRMYQSLK